MVVTATDATNDIVYAETQQGVEHTYGSPGPFTASLSSCCRLSGPEHINNPDGDYAVQTLVDFAGTIASPTSSIAPIIDCPVDAVCNFQVPTTDADNQELRWRMATSAEVSGSSSGFVQPGPPHAPSAATIDPTSGRYTWDTRGATLNTATDGSPAETLYSTQVVIENVVDGDVVSKSSVDFFIRLNGTSRTPLIFVPGIAGSELLYAQSGSTHAEGDEKWLRYGELIGSPFDPFLKDLKLAPNGEDPLTDDPKYDTKVGDILRDEGPLVNPYGPTVETLTREYGYEEGKDLFLFPFDWRKDVRTTRGGSLPGCEGVTLNEFIDCIRERTGSEKVNIMAHSQGGLVTQAALSEQESVGKVDRVLTLGTPFLGAPQAFGILQYRQSCFGKDILDRCVVNSEVVQEIFENFPGAYQLLPSRDYHKVEGSPLSINFQEKSYDYWTGLIRDERNPDIMERADSYHQAQDGISPADNSVQWQRIIGDEVATPGRIREYDLCLPSFTGLSCAFRRGFHMTNGDGTVPLHSADLYNPDPNGDGNTDDEVNLSGGVLNCYLRGVEHGELPIHEGVLDYANDYFGDTVPYCERTVFRSQRTTEESSPTARAEEFGPDEAPSSSFGGIELESVGPVEGYVEDENGNVLGNPPDEPEGLIVEEIPGGQYNAIQDTQSFFLNEAGSFTSSLEVTDDEEGARMRVRTYAEGETTGQAVFQVAAPEGSDLQVGFTDGQELPDLRLHIDEDGDGTAEREEAPDSVATGSAASDTTPPEVEASYEELDRDDARVTIDANDNQGGSGIASIYYSIEGQDSEPRLYEEPFTVPLGSMVRFTAIDKAGNTADVKEIKVGDQPPDRDGDGIPDSSDACPDRPAPGTANGCPPPPPPPADTTAPTGSVKMNNGARTTKSLKVRLSLRAADNPGGTGVDRVCVSNTTRCTSWRPYTASLSWKLSRGETGRRSVYIRYEDKAGNVSALYRDTIRYAPSRK